MAADMQMDWELRRQQLEQELGEPITVDGLSADWRIFQRKRGHRHSTDDLLTAWYALNVAEHAQTALDLGTGIGTVGLLVLSGLPASARLHCVEAQTISHRFLLENLRGNGLHARVAPLHGDLRELQLEQRFPLVTGSPPYFDVSAGVVPADSQKAHARFELRGTVHDYALAARRHLEPDGWFVYCFPWAQRARGVAAAHDAGFSIVRSVDVVPRVGLTPLFSLFACRLGAHTEQQEPDFVVREQDGEHTAQMRAVRMRFGWRYDA